MRTWFTVLPLPAVALWCVLALAASLLRSVGLLSIQAFPLLILSLAVLPIALFVALVRRTRRYHRWVASPARTAALVRAHSWRVLGLLFLVLYARGRLPGSFALPAGLGDVLVGASAPLVARWLTDPTPARRQALVAWNLISTADLLLAVTLAALASPIGPLRGPTTTLLMTTFPLLLIPTFLVPLWLIFHIAIVDHLCGSPAR